MLRGMPGPVDPLAMAGVAAGFAVAFALSVLTYLRLNAKRFSERRQAEAALRQAHHELEQRIAERTADLQATNVSLGDKIDVLKTTESILRETRDQAVQAGKLAVLGQMAAGISHEINQPLTALHTFTDNAVDLLDRGRLDEVRQNLEFIKQMAVRMGHLVGEVKNLLAQAADTASEGQPRRGDRPGADAGRTAPPANRSDHRDPASCRRS